MEDITEISKTLRIRPRPKAVYLSVPVKMALFTGVIYIATLTLLTIIFTFVQTPSLDGLLGMPLSKWSDLGQILLLASLIVISSYVFLDRPLKNLSKNMQKVHNDHREANNLKFSHDEIGELAQNFNRILSKMSNLSESHVEATKDLEVVRRELVLKEKLQENTAVIERANKKLENHIKDLSMLYEIGQKLNAINDLDTLYKVIEEVLKKRLQSQEFALLSLDDEDHTLIAKAAHGFADVDTVKKIVIKVGEGVVGRVAATREPMYLRDVSKDGSFMPYIGSFKREGSILCLPLKHQEKILGVIIFARSDIDAFSDNDMQVLTMIANQIALAIENAKLYTKTCQLSLTDELTGLYNRRHMQNVLQIEWKRATRFKRNLSVLVIDIDHFKKYNDFYGHPSGDEVLKKISSLLRNHVREVDTLARFGGEEFVAILPDTDKKGAIAVAEKLRRLILGQHFVSEDSDKQIPQVTISVGVSSYPDDALELDDLIDHADIALYEAKDCGRNCVRMYPDAVQPAYYEREVEKRQIKLN